MDYKSMGDLIAALRKQQGMTQQDLADKMHVTDKAVSKWERGISYPDINTIPKLAETLNISSDELLTFQKKASPIAKGDLTLRQKINEISTLVLKAVGMAMGIAVLVLSILGDFDVSSGITMLAIGLTCIGIVQFQSK